VADCDQDGMGFRYITSGHEIKCYNMTATFFYRVNGPALDAGSAL